MFIVSDFKEILEQSECAQSISHARQAVAFARAGTCLPGSLPAPSLETGNKGANPAIHKKFTLLHLLRQLSVIIGASQKFFFNRKVNKKNILALLYTIKTYIHFLYAPNNFFTKNRFAGFASVRSFAQGWKLGFEPDRGVDSDGRGGAEDSACFGGAGRAFAAFHPTDEGALTRWRATRGEV
jgi:hypothetical protein